MHVPVSLAPKDSVADALANAGEFGFCNFGSQQPLDALLKCGRRRAHNFVPHFPGIVARRHAEAPPRNNT